MTTTKKVSKQSSSQEVDGFIQKASEWLTSEQGRQALTETVQKTVDLADRLRCAQRVDPKALQEPITV